MNKLNITKKLVALVLSGTTIFALAGCSKKMDCDVQGEHAHRYVSVDGFEGYLKSEYETLDDGLLHWSDTTGEVNDEVNTMTKFDLLKIEDNLEEIEEDTKNDLPFIEYEYKHSYTSMIPAGKVMVPVRHTDYRFSDDPNVSNATGKIRDVEYKYKGYRVGVNTDGELELQESPLVDCLEDIKDDYPYFRVSDFKQQVCSETYEKGVQKVK